jgi:glycosyltransferase involved in cell wall biosynthesis
VNIALDATPLTISTGGVARYTGELARALALEYPEDHFWLLSDQIFEVPQPLLGNLHQGQPPHTLAGRKWWLWGLNQQMSRLGVDLFHGTDFSVPYLRRRPSVLTLHDLSPWMPESGWQPAAGRVRNRTPVLLRMGLATFVITPSEAVRRAAIERFRLSPDRVVAVPLAASGSFRPVETAPSARPYFLFVGTLEPRKNIVRLLEAWREVRKRYDVDLVLAGRVRADFPAPQPEPGLRIMGAVPEQDLPGLYSGAAACVYPSLYEGFGLPVLEAMQCGALVITSTDPAIREVSSDAAIHVDAQDTKALMEALAAVARAPESFSAVRERGLARSREFTWQRTVRLTRDVYDAARQVFHAG